MICSSHRKRVACRFFRLVACVMAIMGQGFSVMAMTRGELLYRLGDREKHISACISCHGPSGQGNAEAGFPVLAAQHSPYILAQLKAFKAGLRQEDGSQIMRVMTQEMSVSDMQALADYIEQLK